MKYKGQVSKYSPIHPTCKDRREFSFNDSIKRYWHHRVGWVGAIFQ